MQITATLKDGNATLQLITNSSRADFTVNDANNLARDLEIFLSNPDAAAVDSHYRVVPSTQPTHQSPRLPR
jgi:hypothetical protein